jgi:hypothetical protein
MLERTAISEAWHIDDGNYPPFHTGMAVNLSFEVVPTFILPAKTSQVSSFTHHGNAEYSFYGKVLRIYNSESRKLFF